MNYLLILYLIDLCKMNYYNLFLRLILIPLVILAIDRHTKINRKLRSTEKEPTGFYNKLQIAGISAIIGGLYFIISELKDLINTQKFHTHF